MSKPRELWHPRAQHVIPRHSSFSLMDLDRPPREILHTTESGDRAMVSDESFYGHQSYPHALCFAERAARGLVPRIVQFVPLDRMSKALRNESGGVETNRWYAIQVEIVWNAGDARNMPRELLDAVKDWVQWVGWSTGCPMVAPIPFHPYPPDGGHRLGSEPWRMGFAAWRNASGVFGHQHAPENVHGDPGDIDIAYVLGSPAHLPTPTGDEFDMADLSDLDRIVEKHTNRIDARPIALRVDAPGNKQEDGKVYVVDVGARTRWYVDRDTLDKLYYTGTIQADKDNQPAKIGLDFVDEFRLISDPTPKS